MYEATREREALESNGVGVSYGAPVRQEGVGVGCVNREVSEK